MIALATRWATLSEDQLAAVAQARCVMGSDGRDLAEEILPGDLARRVDAAWRAYCERELARPPSGGGGGGSGGDEWAAAVAAAECWLARPRGGVAARHGSSPAVASIPLPPEASGGGGGGRSTERVVPGAWLVSPPLALPPPGAPEEPQWPAMASGSGSHAGAGAVREAGEAAAQLVLLLPRGELLTQRPPRLPGAAVMRARVLAALAAAARSGGGGGDSGSAGSSGVEEGEEEGACAEGGGQAPLELLLLPLDDWAALGSSGGNGSGGGTGSYGGSGEGGGGDLGRSGGEPPAEVFRLML